MFPRKITSLLLCLSIGVLLGAKASAQPMGFIYLQSENNKGFRVVWNGNIYPSSSTGYLVVPQMPAGEQVVEIGFPGTIWHNCSFIIPLADKPRGFSLRQTVQNQWVLFDMVTYSQIAGKEILPAATSKPVYEDLVSPLAEKLTVLTPVQKSPEPVPARKETVPMAKVRIPATTAIRKIFDKGSSSGVDQVYVIMTGNRADTIALFIPVLEQNIRQTARLGLLKRGDASKAVKPGPLMSRSLFRLPEPLF